MAFPRLPVFQYYGQTQGMQDGKEASPVRSHNVDAAGFSFSSVPRPRAPFSLYRDFKIMFFGKDSQRHHHGHRTAFDGPTGIRTAIQRSP